ncbi:hypothetical protein ABPG75_002845 [Micractinium tetrahymenae]
MLATPDMPAALNAHNVSRCMTYRDQLRSAVVMEQQLQASGSGLSLLAGLIVRLRKGGMYRLREVQRLSPDGPEALLLFRHAPGLACNPGQVSGSQPDSPEGVSTEAELQEWEQARLADGAAPWTAGEVACARWRLRLIEVFTPRMEEDPATGQLALPPRALDRLARDLVDESALSSYVTPLSPSLLSALPPGLVTSPRAACSDSLASPAGRAALAAAAAAAAVAAVPQGFQPPRDPRLDLWRRAQQQQGQQQAAQQQAASPQVQQLQQVQQVQHGQQHSWQQSPPVQQSPQQPLPQLAATPASEEPEAAVLPQWQRGHQQAQQAQQPAKGQPDREHTPDFASEWAPDRDQWLAASREATPDFADVEAEQQSPAAVAAAVAAVQQQAGASREPTPDFAGFADKEEARAAAPMQQQAAPGQQPAPAVTGQHPPGAAAAAAAVLLDGLSPRMQAVMASLAAAEAELQVITPVAQETPPPLPPPPQQQHGREPHSASMMREEGQLSLEQQPGRRTIRHEAKQPEPAVAAHGRSRSRSRPRRSRSRERSQLYSSRSRERGRAGASRSRSRERSNRRRRSRSRGRGPDRSRSRAGRYSLHSRSCSRGRSQRHERQRTAGRRGSCPTEDDAFWDPEWRLEWRCLQWIRHLGQQSTLSLMSTGGCRDLLPRWLPGADGSRTFQVATFERFLRARPHLFSVNSSGSVQLVPGAEPFLRYKRALLDYVGSCYAVRAPIGELRSKVHVPSGMDRSMASLARCDLATFLRRYLPDCIHVHGDEVAELRAFEPVVGSPPVPRTFRRPCRCEHFAPGPCRLGLECSFAHAPPRGEGSPVRLVLQRCLRLGCLAELQDKWGHDRIDALLSEHGLLDASRRGSVAGQHGRSRSCSRGRGQRGRSSSSSRGRGRHGEAGIAARAQAGEDIFAVPTDFIDPALLSCAACSETAG